MSRIRLMIIARSCDSIGNTSTSAERMAKIRTFYHSKSSCNLQFNQNSKLSIEKSQK